VTLSLPVQSWRQAAPAPVAVPVAAPVAPRAASRLPIHDAQALCGAEGLAHILLGDQTYTLRITRAGKLILTK
jgi:hemin uptake protein HemP